MTSGVGSDRAVLSMRQTRVNGAPRSHPCIGGHLSDTKLRFLSGASGAGLIFAALTNTFAMSWVLGLLPYNRVSRNAVGQAVTQLTRR